MKKNKLKRPLIKSKREIKNLRNKIKVLEQRLRLPF